MKNQISIISNNGISTSFWKKYTWKKNITCVKSDFENYNPDSVNTSKILIIDGYFNGISKDIDLLNFINNIRSNGYYGKILIVSPDFAKFNQSIGLNNIYKFSFSDEFLLELNTAFLNPIELKKYGQC